MRVLLGFVSLLVFAFFLAPPGSASARPFRGSTKIYVILCQTSDSGAAPQTIDHYRNLLFTPGTGGLADWWHDISYVNFDNAGSEIHGWYRLG